MPKRWVSGLRPILESASLFGAVQTSLFRGYFSWVVSRENLNSIHFFRIQTETEENHQVRQCAGSHWSRLLRAFPHTGQQVSQTIIPTEERSQEFASGGIPHSWDTFFQSSASWELHCNPHESSSVYTCTPPFKLSLSLQELLRVSPRLFPIRPSSHWNPHLLEFYLTLEPPTKHISPFSLSSTCWVSQPKVWLFLPALCLCFKLCVSFSFWFIFVHKRPDFFKESCTLLHWDHVTWWCGSLVCYWSVPAIDGWHFEMLVGLCQHWL